MNISDLKIIRQLMLNARTTWAELGTLLGLTAPAAADRVRRLEERGVIHGYTALIDPVAVGWEVLAFIDVTLEHPSVRGRFVKAVADLPQIQECHHIAGEHDYRLKVRCRSIRELESLISDCLKEVPGVAGSRTTIVLSTLKETPILPFPDADPGAGAPEQR